MAILIDGYNLLNATGVEGTGGGTELRRARRGLLGFLADALSQAELSTTTIVFDAQGAPPGLPQQEFFHGITVLYSQGYAEADDLLEELIASDHAPRRLLVVSSDHRLHRAARRRRATPIDSEIWIAQLESRGEGSAGPAQQRAKTAPPADTDSWLAEFADVDVEAIRTEVHGKSDGSPATGDVSQASASQPDVTQPSGPKPTKDGLRGEDLDDARNPFPDSFGDDVEKELHRDAAADQWNPFPPGYGEDLTDEDVSP